MAYIRCGNKDCSFCQDDFWTFRFKPQWKFWRWTSVFGYNPLTILSEHIGWLIKPRWIGFDKWYIDEIYEDHGFKIRNRTRECMRVHKSSTVGSTESNIQNLEVINKYEVFSWSLLRWETYRAWLKFKKMKWWTYQSYKNDPHKLCPKCSKPIPSSMID